MKQENVKIGDKVVPFQKTRQSHIINWTKFLDFGNDTSKFFRENGYLIVKKSLQGFFYLGNGNDKCDKFEFNASDFEPYIEPAKDNNIQTMFVVDNKTVVYLTGARRGASACLPSDAFDPVKGLAMAYMRALGQTVDDIRIEINPKQNAPQEDKPLTCEGCKYGDRVIQDAQINKPLTFEVGEMVKFRDDLIGGKEYDRMTYCDGMKNDFPKTFALPKPNSVGNCCLKGWHFPLTMLEKVPQSTKHGLKEAWEEVKRWADSALYAEWKDSHDRH